MAKGQLTATEYAASVWQIRDLERRSDHRFSDVVTGIPKLLAATIVPAGQSNNAMILAMQNEQTKHPGHPVNMALVYSTLWVGLLFIPFAALILLMRLATVTQSRYQFKTVARERRLELTGASLFWGIGLLAFNPDDNQELLWRIAELSRRDEPENGTSLETKRQQVFELIHSGQLGAASTLQAIWAMLSLIWTGSWRHSPLTVRFAYAKQAVYVSLIGTLMITFGQVRVYAQNSNGVVQKVLINYNRLLDGPTTENAFFWLKGGGQVVIYGYSTAHPTYELTWETTRLKLPIGQLTAGPLIDVSYRGQLASYGATGGYAGKFGNATLTTPWYFYRSAKGRDSFNLPNIRATWPLNKTIDFGFGGATSLADKKEPSFLVGVIFNLKGKGVTLMGRVGQFLTGPSRGQNQLRLDLVFKP